jgi:hypothetical protein
MARSPGCGCCGTGESVNDSSPQDSSSGLPGLPGRAVGRGLLAGGSEGEGAAGWAALDVAVPVQPVRLAQVMVATRAGTRKSG